jgi:hypothetical protein
MGEVMKVVFYNFKGGVGKTSIGVNYALSNDMAFITNDIYSPVEDIFPPERFMKVGVDNKFPDLPSDIDVVFDLGGYVDGRVLEVVRGADAIVVPLSDEYKDKFVTVSFIEEIQEFTSKIVIVANKLENKASYFNIKRIIDGKFGDGAYPIVPIKITKAFNHVTDSGDSLHEIVKKGGANGYHFKPVLQQFKQLERVIEKVRVKL